MQFWMVGVASSDGYALGDTAHAAVPSPDESTSANAPGSVVGAVASLETDELPHANPPALARAKTFQSAICQRDAIVAGVHAPCDQVQ